MLALVLSLSLHRVKAALSDLGLKTTLVAPALWQHLQAALDQDAYGHVCYADLVPLLFDDSYSTTSAQDDAHHYDSSTAASTNAYNGITTTAAATAATGGAYAVATARRRLLDALSAAFGDLRSAEAAARRALSGLDARGSGGLSRAELRRALARLGVGGALSSAELEALCSRCVTGGSSVRRASTADHIDDDVVDHEEFVRLLFAPETAGTATAVGTVAERSALGHGIADSASNSSSSFDAALQIALAPQRTAVARLRREVTRLLSSPKSAGTGITAAALKVLLASAGLQISAAQTAFLARKCRDSAGKIDPRSLLAYLSSSSSGISVSAVHSAASGNGRRPLAAEKYSTAAAAAAERRRYPIENAWEVQRKHTAGSATASAATAPHSYSERAELQAAYDAELYRGSASRAPAYGARQGSTGALR
jgi:hypothetical protein